MHGNHHGGCCYYLKKAVSGIEKSTEKQVDSNQDKSPASIPQRSKIDQKEDPKITKPKSTKPKSTEKKSTENVFYGPNSTFSQKKDKITPKKQSNITNIDQARTKKVQPTKQAPPNRTGTKDERILNDMLYALENVLIDKPSGTNLRKYAGRRVNALKGSKSTVAIAQEIGSKNGWCIKPDGKQWQWVNAHIERVKANGKA